MKKTLISFIALMIVAPVMAADNCAYSPLQNLIRNVRRADEIVALMNKGVVFSEKTRCGGSLMQLAILRGNPQVLDVLLQRGPSQANEMVTLDAFPIPGVRGREIPLILFAAYYAPNPNMVTLLVNAGADISKVDADGRNLLWYMERNPVLRNTDLYDQLNDRLLSSLVPSQQTRPLVPMVGQTMQVGTEPVAVSRQPQLAEPIPAKASVVEASEN